MLLPVQYISILLLSVSILMLCKTVVRLLTRLILHSITCFPFFSVNFLNASHCMLMLLNAVNTVNTMQGNLT